MKVKQTMKNPKILQNHKVTLQKKTAKGPLNPKVQQQKATILKKIQKQKKSLQSNITI